MTMREKIFRSRLTAIMASAAMIAQPALAQTVADQGVPEAGLNIPANAQLFGDPNSNVYRPTATVNGEIITATDVDQRLALVRIANGGQVPAEELQRLRVEIFGQLVDEMLQIQEAHANEIEVPDADIASEFARIAASLRQSPEQFTQFLAANGSSLASMRQQIRGNLAWQRLLGRNVEPFTNVSQEEVQAMIERLQSQRGLEEFRVGEIYLRTTPETIAPVAENAQRIMESLSNGSVTFQDAAHRFSEASSAASGGDLGWLRLTQLPASIAEAAQAMAHGQMAGPIESPGGISILLMIDKRRVLTADPRDATLSLKQVSLTFPTGTTAARANELAGNFQTRTRSIAGCGMADQVANELGAEVISRDQIAMRDLPAPLQSALGAMQIGQVTQMFGSPQQGVSVLVLCGREMPTAATTPTVDDVADRIQQERVQRRAQRYMRDLRRDAVIDYS